MRIYKNVCKLQWCLIKLNIWRFHDIGNVQKTGVRNICEIFGISSNPFIRKNIFSIALCNKQASFFLFLMKFFALYIAISQLKWFFKQMISENDCFVYISQLTLCISSNFKTLKIRIQDTVKEPFTNILTYILKENIHDI